MLDDNLDVESLLQEVQKREEAGNAEDNYLGYRALSTRGIDAVVKIEFDDKAREATAEFRKENRKLSPSDRREIKFPGPGPKNIILEKYADYFNAMRNWYNNHYEPRMVTHGFFNMEFKHLEHAIIEALHSSKGDLTVYAFDVDNQVNVLLHSPEGGLKFKDKHLENTEELRYNNNETSIALQYTLPS